MNYWDKIDDEVIEAVWDELSCRFGFPKAVWKSDFENKHTINKHFPLNSFFMSYGSGQINDILNLILRRGQRLETFSDLVKEVMTRMGRL